MERRNTIMVLTKWHHVELVQYDNTNSVTYQPAFRWWANQTLRKKDILLAKIAARKMSKNKIKCGIEIPNNVSWYKLVDHDTNNTLWQNTLAKEVDKQEGCKRDVWSTTMPYPYIGSRRNKIQLKMQHMYRSSFYYDLQHNTCFLYGINLQCLISRYMVL